MNKESQEKMLYNGRKCVYAYQCISRICDEETNICKGRGQGDSCSDHIECDQALACRPSSIWPYETQCLPMADVGSLCNTEFDCKPRNFCWKLEKGANGKCLEKHTAPDGVKFLWDNERYPEVNKKSVLAHG